MRRMTVVVALIGAALCAGPALGGPQKKRGEATPVCKQAYRRALKYEKAGHLSAAQTQLLSCAKAKCGVFLEHECTIRHAQIASERPSVVPVVTDRSGEPVIDVEVTMDGAILTSRIDGRAVVIEPGLHEFSFSTAGGGVFATRRVMILQGERNRPIAASLRGARRANRPAAVAGGARPAAVETAAPVPGKAPAPSEAPASNEVLGPEPTAALVTPPPAPSRPERPSRLPAYLLLGTGVAGLGGYGVLTYWGRKDNDLLSECSPDCPPSSLTHIRRMYLAANISLGVGAAALGLGSWLLWRNHSRYAVEVQPTSSGAMATASGSF